MECRRLIPRDAAALREVAALHRRVLAESMVSVLGARVLVRYYEFLATADRDAVLACWVDGRVAGAAVVSEDPEALMGTFVRRAGLGTIWQLVGGTLRSAEAAKRAIGSLRQPEPPHAVEGLPEVIQLFVDGAVQGRGIGKAVLAGVEAHLTERGHRAYYVKTLADADNAALGFYARLGFVPSGEQTLQGFRFRFLTKPLS